MYSWWWVELSPEICRVKPLRRINATVASCWIYFTSERPSFTPIQNKRQNYSSVRKPLPFPFYPRLKGRHCTLHTLFGSYRPLYLRHSHYIRSQRHCPSISYWPIWMKTPNLSVFFQFAFICWGFIRFVLTSSRQDNERQLKYILNPSFPAASVD